MLTGIVNVVQGLGQDLQRTREVHQVELVLQHEQHFDDRVGIRRGSLRGHLGQLGSVVKVGVKSEGFCDVLRLG